MTNVDGWCNSITENVLGLVNRKENLKKQIGPIACHLGNDIAPYFDRQIRNLESKGRERCHIQLEARSNLLLHL